MGAVFEVPDAGKRELWGDSGLPMLVFPGSKLGRRQGDGEEGARDASLGPPWVLLRHEVTSSRQVVAREPSPIWLHKRVTQVTGYLMFLLETEVLMVLSSVHRLNCELKSHNLVP